MPRRVMLALLLALISGVAGAEAYQWRDADGRVHYGDRPPAGHRARPVGEDLAERNVIRAVPVEPAPREEGEPPTAQDVDRRAEHCRRLRGELAQVKEALRAGYRPREGERLRDRERELRRARVRDCW